MHKYNAVFLESNTSRTNIDIFDFSKGCGVAPFTMMVGGQEVTLRRIVGGKEVMAHSMPWHVGILFSHQTESNPRPLCGGTIVSSNVVLTAAHCDKWQENIQSAIFKAKFVLAREHDTTDKSYGTTHAICKFLQHPSYDPMLYRYDVALAFLEKPIVFDNKARPACLPTSKMAGNFLTNKELIVSGWGHTEYGGELSDRLLAVKVKALSNGGCQEYYKLQRRPIFSEQLCGIWKGGGRDSCQGDSGGMFDRFCSILQVCYSCTSTDGVKMHDTFLNIFHRSFDIP